MGFGWAVLSFPYLIEKLVRVIKLWGSENE